MKRKTYIYWAIPSFTALSCVSSLFAGILPTLPALIVAVLLIILCWSLIWLRFYQSKALRPEFSILAIVPMLIYVLTRIVPAESYEYFLHPTWQNAYFFLWVTSGIVISYSFAPSIAEREELEGKRDPVRMILLTVTCAYIVTSWFATNNAIFGILHS